MRLWVDEGHGGSDSGAVAGGKSEDARNLTLGNRVEALGKQQGWSVSSTRSADVATALSTRYTKANAYDADVFLSLHHDWDQGRQAVIYPKNHDITTSRRLADYINRRIDPLAPTAGEIYADRRGLAVLNGTDMPAVIIEASRVQDAYNVPKMAEAIVRGICDFIKRTYVGPGAGPGAPATPTGGIAGRKAVMREDSQLWNATIGTKRSPSPKKGGIVYQTSGPTVTHNGNKYVPIAWGGNSGWIRYDHIRYV